MSDANIQLTAEGFDPCIKPQQVPTNSLMEEYMRVKDQVTKSTDPSTHVQADKVKIGTGESLIVNGQVRFTSLTVKFDHLIEPDQIQESNVIITDGQSGVKEVNFIGSDRREISFHRQDDSNQIVNVDALLAGNTVLSEKMDIPSKSFVSIDFNSDGTAKGGACIDHRGVWYHKNSMWDGKNASITDNHKVLK